MRIGRRSASALARSLKKRPMTYRDMSLVTGQFSYVIYCSRMTFRKGKSMAEERTEKSRALDLAVSQIEKQFGKGSIMRLGGIDSSAALDAISSGSLSLDAAMGVGGFPRGRVIEIFGPESSGKTTLSLHVIAEAQKLGGTA